MEKNVYFKLGAGIVDFSNPLSEEWYQLGDSWEDYLKDRWVALTDEQKAFYVEHPDATVKEVFDMRLTPDPPEENLLAKAKKSKLLEIEQYDTSNAVNSFTIGGQEMWLGFEERSRLLASVQAYEAMGREEMTKWFNGTPFTFSISVWKQMLASLEIYASEALNVTEAKKAAVDSLDNIQDVQEYNVAAGYPERLEF